MFLGRAEAVAEVLTMERQVCIDYESSVTVVRVLKGCVKLINKSYKKLYRRFLIKHSLDCLYPIISFICLRYYLIMVHLCTNSLGYKEVIWHFW